MKKLGATEEPEPLPAAPRHLLCLSHLGAEEILEILARAEEMKSRGRAPGPLLAGKCFGMLFRKPSTRTRVSFAAACAQLGAQALTLDPGELQLSRGETLADTARVLSRYLDGILVRTFEQKEVEELARHSSVPVINGLTDDVHPTQVLADLLTIREHLGRLEGVVLAYVGDGNNVAHSLLQAAGKLGLHFRGAFPPGYGPRPEYVEEARLLARRTGGSVTLTSSPPEAVRGAHVVYTDVWTSMGREEEREKRALAFQGFQVTPELFRLAHPEAIFLHCLPAHRGEEVASEVLDGPRSRVWEQAANRLHVFKGILLWMSKI